MKISVIVPCHNEASLVEMTYKKIKSVLQRHGYDYEIVLEEDGSTDETGAIIRDIAKHDKKVRALSFPSSRNGKGWGFKKLVEAASGDILISMDADLSVSPEVIPFMIKEMKNADILLTDRYSHRDSKIPKRRFIPSRIYNFMLRLMFGIRSKDTQSGFKAYRRETFKKISLKTDGFAYDIELLAKAYKAGLIVKEIPVKYLYRQDARFSVKKHGPKMVLNTIRLWRDMKM